MPWNNQSGGGPWGGGGNDGGPWGQGPRGPSGGPQGSPPDLEEIIRRGQDRLKRILPGGGGPSPAMFALIILVIAGLWLFKAIYSVQPDQMALELRFGEPKQDISEPGLHFHWWPIETVELVSIAERLVSIGEERGGTSSGLMLSGDQNIVDVTFSVAYEVADPAAYLFNVDDPDGMVRQVAESAMREVVGRRPAEDIFRDDRQGIAGEVQTIIQTSLDDYGAGMSVNALSIEDAAPPREVADAFEEVQRAEQDEARFVEEANQYSNQQLGQARGEAARIREEAAAYKNRVVLEAQGEAQRFVSVYDEYAQAPDVTRQRLFLETMEDVLRGSSKVIVGQENGQGVVPYLPLPELRQRMAPGNQNNNNVQSGLQTQGGN